MSATAEEMALIVRAKNMASGPLRTVGADLDRLNTKTTSMGTAFTTAGRLAKAGMIVVGAAVVAGVATAVGAWVGFDAKMTESLAIMGEDAQEWRDEMETAAREVAKTTTFSAEDAAQSYYYLASAGMDAQQSIAALPAVAMFAQAGMFDMATATDLATDAQSALGLSSDDAATNLEGLTRVTDVLVSANTLANASVQQFSEALTNKAGAAMRGVGMDIEEGVAVLAAFADQGLKGAEAGTALHIVMRDLQTAAINNADEFANAGVAVYDANGEFRNMADIVGDLEEALAGMSDEQRKATLAELGFTDKSIGFLQVLLGTSDAIRGYEDALRDAGGTTEEVANNQLKSISAQWDIFKSKVKDVFIGLGEKLAPALEKIIGWLSDFAEDTLPKVIDTLGEWGGKIAEVAGIIWDKLIEAVRAIIDWWDNLSPEMQDAIKFGGILAGVFVGLAIAIGLVEAALGVLLSPFVLVVAALVAIGAALKLAYEKFEWFRDIVDAVVKWFKEDALEDLQTAWENIVSVVSTAWETIQSVFETVMGFLKGLWEAWGDDILSMAETIWNFITAVIETAWGVIQAIFETVSGIISWIWENWGDTLLTLAETIWGMITGAIQGAWDIIQGIFETFTGLLTLDWDTFWNGLKGIASGAWELVVSWFTGVKDTFVALWDEAWQGISDFFGEIWDGLKGIASDAWQTVVDWWDGVWSTFKDGWDTTWDTLSEGVETAFNAVAGVISGALDTIKDAFYTSINYIIDQINKLIRAYNRIPIVPDISELGHIGTPTKTHGPIPGMAGGGTAISSGLALVGESGPEILSLTKGASVVPLQPRDRSVGAGGEIHLHIHGVDLSDSRRAIEKIREGIRQLDLEAG